MSHETDMDARYADERHGVEPLPERESERAEALEFAQSWIDMADRGYALIPENLNLACALLAESARADRLAERVEGELRHTRANWDATSQARARWQTRAERAEAQLGVAREGLREIAETPCLLDSEHEPDPRTLTLGDGDCPSCFAGLLLARLNTEPPAEQAGVEAKDASE